MERLPKGYKEIKERSTNGGIICSDDNRASQAGCAVLRTGGSAIDAAITVGATLAVLHPESNGMGGDLFAQIVSPDGKVYALNASGRAGSGADPARLRAEGNDYIPTLRDIRVTTVPGCVDGWVELHKRFGSKPLEELFEAGISYAEEGFEPAFSLDRYNNYFRENNIGGANDYLNAEDGIVRRPGIVRTLKAIADKGRKGFYEGEFGEGLVAIGNGEYTKEDLRRNQAEWVEPLHLRVFDRDIWTLPPNSQGYSLLLGLGIAEGLDFPDSIDDPLATHLLIESMRAAGHDKWDVLHEDAGGQVRDSLLTNAEILKRRTRISSDRRAPTEDTIGGGGTTSFCVVDQEGWAVVVQQSNYGEFGSFVIEPNTGINLSNRGRGFNLTAGHPAEYRPGRRPPHTLMPVAVTGENGETLIGATRGGTSQADVMAQIFSRVLIGNQTVGEAIDARRWALAHREEPRFGDRPQTTQSTVVEIESDSTLRDALQARGHSVREVDQLPSSTNVIQVFPDGRRVGATDPRTFQATPQLESMW